MLSDGPAVIFLINNKTYPLVPLIIDTFRTLDVQLRYFIYIWAVLLECSVKEEPIERNQFILIATLEEKQV